MTLVVVEPDGGVNFASGVATEFMGYSNIWETDVIPFG
jgi:hypothetical protein